MNSFTSISHVNIHILEYLSPKENVVVSKVSKKLQEESSQACLNKIQMMAKTVNDEFNTQEFNNRVISWKSSNENSYFLFLIEQVESIRLFQKKEKKKSFEIALKILKCQEHFQLDKKETVEKIKEVIQIELKQTKKTNVFFLRKQLSQFVLSFFSKEKITDIFFHCLLTNQHPIYCKNEQGKFIHLLHIYSPDEKDLFLLYEFFGKNLSTSTIKTKTALCTRQLSILF